MSHHILELMKHHSLVARLYAWDLSVYPSTPTFQCSGTDYRAVLTSMTMSEYGPEQATSTNCGHRWRTDVPHDFIA